MSPLGILCVAAWFLLLFGGLPRYGVSWYAASPAQLGVLGVAGALLLGLILCGVL